MLENAPDAVFTVDERGTLVDLNAAAERLFGLTRATDAGRRIRELIVPPRHIEAQERALERLVRGEGTTLLGRRVEVSALDAAGREIPVEMTVTRTSEEPAQFTVWVRDLTDSENLRARARQRRTLLERAEAIAQTGSWEWTPELERLIWSDNLFRIYGFDPGEVTPSVALLRERVHPDDRDRFASVVERLEREGEMDPLRYRVIHDDGTIRHLLATVAVIEEGDGPRRIVGSVQDLSERLRANREIEAHIAVSEALGGWTTFETGAELLLSRLGGAMDLEVGLLWIATGGLLSVSASWASQSIDADAFLEVSRRLRLPRGRALPGRAWAAAEPVALEGLESAPNRERREAARVCGLRGGLALPALFKTEVLAVVEFWSREEVELSERLGRSLTGIGHELGAFLARRRGELGAPQLTARELEVLQLAARGRSGPKIAAELMISPATVKTHFEHIYAKLDVFDRGGAVAAALRLGLIE